MLRWLLPIFTVFALLGQAVMAFAAAGVIGKPNCCCPIKAKCKCHDHDGKSPSAPTLKRCAGEAKVVAPAQAPTVPAIEIVVIAEQRVAIAPALAPAPMPDDVTYELETPPF